MRLDEDHRVDARHAVEHIVAERRQVAIGGDDDAVAEDLGQRPGDRSQAECRAPAIDDAVQPDVGAGSGGLPQQPIDPRRQRLRADHRRRRGAGRHRARAERHHRVRHIAPVGDRIAHQLRARADDDVGAFARARDRREHPRGLILHAAEHPAHRIEPRLGRLHLRRDVGAVGHRLESAPLDPVEKVRRR